MLPAGVRAPRAIERLLVVGVIKLEGENRHKMRVEPVDLPVVFDVHQLHTLERSAGVRPVQWRDQSLGAVEQFLAADANRTAFVEAAIDKCVEKVTAVDVD